MFQSLCNILVNRFKRDADYFTRFLVIISILSGFKAKERISIKVKRAKRESKMKLIKRGNVLT